MKTAGTEITVHTIRSGDRAAEISGDQPTAITDSTATTTADGQKIPAPVAIRTVLVTMTVIRVTRGHLDIDFHQITSTDIDTTIDTIPLVVIIIPIIIITVTGLRHLLRQIRIGTRVAAAPVLETTTMNTTYPDTLRIRATAVGVPTAITFVRFIVPMIAASKVQRHRTK